MSEKKVYIIPCSGIGKVFGSIGRETTYIAVNELAKGKAELECLPLIVKGKKEVIEKLKDNKIIVIDGCPLKCSYNNVMEQVAVLHGNLLTPIPEPVNLIVANLPYIKSSELAALSPVIVDFEPRVAIDGGRTGLNQICRLLEQIQGKTRACDGLLLEIGNEQDKAVVSMINHYLPKANFKLISDLNGIKRVAKVSF